MVSEKGERRIFAKIIYFITEMDEGPNCNTAEAGSAGRGKEQNEDEQDEERTGGLPDHCSSKGG